MRHLVFTIAITLTSRSLILRDRLQGLPTNALCDRSLKISFTRHHFRSGGNLLDAMLVIPDKPSGRACILICPGIGETLEHWAAAQTLLATNGVASFVFSYSGFAKSTGWISAQHCEDDAVAAFGFLQELMPSTLIAILGYSLGSAVAAKVVSRVRAHSLLLCAAFTSLRQAARSIGVPRPLRYLLPDIWNTEQALHDCAIPVLIIHGQEDRLFPPGMARHLAAACGSSCELIVVPEVSHNAPIYNPQIAYWSAIVTRL